MSKVLVDEEKLGKLLKNRLQSVIDVLYANKGQDPKIWREMSERAWPDDTELLKMGMDFLEAKPLTPAQERAGDEEEWVVVRKDRLSAHLEGTYCIGCPVNAKECSNATMSGDVAYVEARFRKVCLYMQMEHLTTPAAKEEKGGEK